MKFTEQTPEEVLINPSAKNFLEVLDATQTWKENQIDVGNRFYRGPLSNNLTFMKKRLEGDYGFPDIPTDFPKDVMDALLLNAKDINALRGSKAGLKLWLWCLTFGDITVDDSLFAPVPEFIQLSDPYSGFVSKIDPEYPATASDPDLYLFADMSMYGNNILTVDISTMYYNHASIPDYINTHIKKYLTFVTSGAVITINFTNGVYTTNAEPYQYFVIP